MKNILVTGGAGYIGSFMVKRLLDEGYTVSVIDSLERGNRSAVDQRASLYVGNLLDKSFLERSFKNIQFDAVMHFAAFISVGESVEYPDQYFKNNTFGSLSLLEFMRANNIPNIIFSSTAGVYGNPQQIPIPEDHPKHPESPYGESKLLVENALSWYHKQFNLNFVSLRYFNAAGAALDGSMGEMHPVESHIIPNIFKAISGGVEFTLFGDDYSTEDGSCVRDYIHINDLVEAHMLAMKKLETEKGGLFFNVGTGNGLSNKQLIAEVERVTGKKVPLIVSARREGDPAVLVADSNLIKKELGFAHKYSDIQTIIESAWKWHNSRG